jgi:hypothetical protein
MSHEEIQAQPPAGASGMRAATVHVARFKLFKSTSSPLALRNSMKASLAPDKLRHHSVITDLAREMHKQNKIIGSSATAS